MKKDKKWLVDKWTKERNETDVHDPMYQFISEFIADVNQLDEPEVLSSDWIKDNQLMWTSIHGSEYYVPANKLYGKIVPKQEETNDDLYILKVGGGYMTGFELTGGRVSAFSRESEYGADVVMASKPFMEFVQKQVGGELCNITNPEEQKYNVKLKVKSSFGTVGIFLYKKGDEVLAGDNFRNYYPKEEEYMLTEQEIRGFQSGDILFEHFAKPVEEMEE